MSHEKRDWREICEAASRENDSDRLIALISELMDALDEQRSKSYQPAQY